MGQCKTINWQKIAICVAAVFTLTAPLVVGLLTREASLATVVALCGAFVALLVKIDNLLELSLGPVKAKMREAIQKASATVDQLQELATVSASAQLHQLAHSFFAWGNSNRIELVNRRNEIVQTLRKLQVEEAAINAAQAQWRKGVSCVYHRYVLHYLTRADARNGVNLDASALSASLKEVQAAFHFDTWTAAGPDQLQRLLQQHGVFTDELKQWIDDYRSFLETGEIRREALFSER